MNIVLYLSFLAITLEGIYIVRTRRREPIYMAFLFVISCVFVWALGFVLDRVFTSYGIEHPKIPLYLATMSATLYPIGLWITAMILRNRDFKLSRKYLLTCIVPLISNIILWTNDWTGLFYKNFYSLSSNNVDGPYLLYVHLPYSYIFVALWLINIYIYAANKSRLFSKQASLIILGTCVPLIINVLFGAKIVFSAYWLVASYAFALLCYSIAIGRYNFLKVVPIAREKIIDNIADGYVVLGRGFDVQDFNRRFVDIFGSMAPIALGDNFIDILSRCGAAMGLTVDFFKKTLEKNAQRQVPMPKEIHFTTEKMEKWLSVIMTYLDKNREMGSFVTFRDITYQKQRENILIERIKLRGFVQIAGDLAHDINTPLSLARNCAADVDEVFNKKGVDLSMIPEKIEYLKYKSRTAFNSCEKSLKIANKLRNQISTLFNESRMEFDLKNVILNVVKWDYEIMMLMKSLGCCYVLNGDMDIKVIGYPLNFTKIVKNVVKNAIESYREKVEESRRTIEIDISKADDFVTVAFRDHGIGIKKELQADIFMKPLKTKNLKLDGGGISLFFAPLIATGQLEGKIWFESTEGEGSTFYISMPLVCRKREKENLL